MSEPRQLGTATDYHSFMVLLRARAAELKVSRDVLDEVSGLGARYVSKLLGPRPVRRVGMKTLGPLLGALGVRLVVEEDPEAMARFCKRNGFGKRDARLVRSASVHIELSQREMKKRQRNGGLNSRKNMTPRRARQLARNAAHVRWERVKQIALGQAIADTATTAARARGRQ